MTHGWLVRLEIGVVDIVGCCLIDVVIQPVRVEQLRGRAPIRERLLRRIVVREVMLGNFGVDALLHIAEVLFGERLRIVFRVAEHEEVAAVGALGDEYARFIRHSDNLKTRMRFDVFHMDFGVARMRCVKDVIDTAHERARRLHDLMREDARHLVVEDVLVDAEVIVDARLRSPADIERGEPSRNRRAPQAHR